MKDAQRTDVLTFARTRARALVHSSANTHFQALLNLNLHLGYVIFLSLSSDRYGV